MNNIDFQTRHNFMSLTEIKILIRQYNLHQPDFWHKIRLSQNKHELIGDLYVRTKRDIINNIKSIADNRIQLNDLYIKLSIDHPQEFLDYLFKRYCFNYNRNERNEE